jgi:hypothetical protein
MYITNMHTTPKNADCKLQTACVDISFNKPAAVTGQETWHHKYTQTTGFGFVAT